MVTTLHTFDASESALQPFRQEKTKETLQAHSTLLQNSLRSMSFKCCVERVVNDSNKDFQAARFNLQGIFEMTPAKDTSLPFNAPYGSSQTAIPDSTWFPASSGINPAEVQARIMALCRSDWRLSYMDADKMALEEFSFAAPQSGRPDTKAASRRREAVTKVRKDAEAKARDEAAVVAQEQAAAKAKAEAEANLRPPLLFVLPKLSLTDSFRATSNRLLEEAARALYFSPRVIACALQNGQPLRDI
jgi:hypothetical protein